MTLRLLHHVVGVLALIVPQDSRARWREEWLGEILHVASTRGTRAAFRIVLGALPDAVAFRKVRIGAADRGASDEGSARGLMNSSILDFKLGMRMLVKYPGLTLVGGLGMAVAIAIGAGSFAFFYSYMNPALPLDEGERVTGIENWDAAASSRENRTLHDFLTWRQELKSIEDVGAYREITRNLITQSGMSERIRIAEITASGFRLARIAPLLGRPVVEEDERKGAFPVVVIGAKPWRTHFASDPAVIGKTVRLGNTVHTIVGVMPDGFAFPVYHDFWIPLQADPSDYERRQGPAINVFGRLAAGVTREGAQAELTTIGLRAAANFPKSNDQLRPRLAPYASLWFGDDMVTWHLHAMQFIITMLLIVVCVNVAALVYARTASRDGEIAIRSALGGSRRRIVAQLFLEALVLCVVAAVAGLVIADGALTYVNHFMEQMGGVPFWMGNGLSLGTVLYVVGLAFLGAAIVGAVPALKATGRRLEPGLRQLGGGSRLRLGGTWTALIVAQVALAVALMPTAFAMGWDAVRYRTFDAGFAAHEFLTARLSMERDVAPSGQAEAQQPEFATRFSDRVAAVVRELESEPGVVGVTIASRLPGDEPTVRIEVEEANAASKPAHAVRVGWVGIDLFDVFQIPVLAGRRFALADFTTAPSRSVPAVRVPTISGKIGQAVGSNTAEGRLAAAKSSAIIVNRSFAQQIFGDGNVLGRRVRYAGKSPESDGWFDIVGVVADFPATKTELSSADARMYHPATAEHVHPVSVAVRVRGNSTTNLANRLREITTSTDPTLQLSDVLSLDQSHREEQRFVQLGALAFALVTLSVVLLSAAGIYALMSFTVAQRRREIGIRAALGADPRRILAGIFARAFRQLAVGVVLGLIIAVGLFEAAETSGPAAVLLPAVAMTMMMVGLLAAVGPARRGLQIDPTESLRAEN